MTNQMNPTEQDNQRAIEWIEGVDACCFIDFPVSTARKAYVAGMNYERKEWEEKFKTLQEENKKLREFAELVWTGGEFIMGGVVFSAGNLQHLRARASFVIDCANGVGVKK